MTFYHIIFGLLFVGAFAEVISALAKGPDWNLFCLAATLSVLVVSDVIYTSVVIESKKYRYTMKMMLLDLLSFILLSFAVITLNPTSHMFEVDATEALRAFVSRIGSSREALFWFLLTIYMLNLYFWNKLMMIEDPIKRQHYQRFYLVQPTYALIFAFMCLMASHTSELGVVLNYFRMLVLIAVLAYLVIYKSYMCSNSLEGIVTLKRLTDKDVSAINTWPPYKSPIDVLDYALRPGGWLDQYPESPTNVRYGIWQDEKLIGFSLLTDIKNGDAEFYIALHADKTHKKIGQGATVQTIQRGFREHGLKRIHLKVRDWYGAKNMYEHVGFRECGDFEEVLQGKSVKFVAMEIYRQSRLRRLYQTLIDRFK